MKPTFIIIHCSDTEDSGTVSWAAIRRYHVGTLGWSDVGYHLCCEQVGNEFEIMTGRPLNHKGAHCRAGGMNNQSLGFCFVGKFEDHPPPPDQLDKAAKYIAGLCSALDISTANIKAHRDYEPHKTCPGKAFDMKQFRELVREYT